MTQEYLFFCHPGCSAFSVHHPTWPLSGGRDLWRSLATWRGGMGRDGLQTGSAAGRWRLGGLSLFRNHYQKYCSESVRTKFWKIQCDRTCVSILRRKWLWNFRRNFFPHHLVSAGLALGEPASSGLRLSRLSAWKETIFNNFFLKNILNFWFRAYPPPHPPCGGGSLRALQELDSLRRRRHLKNNKKILWVFFVRQV